MIALFYSMNLLSQIASRTYKWGFISSGNNFPDFTLSPDSLRLLLISLHLNITADEFCKTYNWDKKEYQEYLRIFKDKNLISETGGISHPNVMVISDQDGQEMFSAAEPVAVKISDALILHLDTIKDLYRRSDISSRVPFDSISFFILSDVLLDNWQIDNVEKEFLKKERPLRHGKNYYISLMQNSRPQRESFGIYGNDANGEIMTYGNNRYNFRNEREKAEAKKNVILFRTSDQRIFQDLATSFKPALIQILNDNRSYLESKYLKSKYSKEVSSEEYCIWLYHFIYTRVTDILAQNKYLKIPVSGNFYYKFQSVESQMETYKDKRDGRIYNTVKIGDQTWFAENLSFKPENGKCWAYENNSSYASKFGYLYDWETAKNVCPAGWHLPQEAEWTSLIDYLGGEAEAGGKLKATTDWKYDVRGNANNESGFCALPAGNRYYVDGSFDKLSESTWFWSGTPRGDKWALTYCLSYFDDGTDKAGYSRAFGYSVRCIKD